MWVLMMVALMALGACLLAFVRGGSGSYWDHPRLLDREYGKDPARSRKIV